MKRIPGALLVLAIATVVSVLTPAVLAQEEHGEFGVFADMTRLRHLNNTNFWGVGGRLVSISTIGPSSKATWPGTSNSSLTARTARSVQTQARTPSAT
jgi:hypothetical protein